MPIPRPTTRLTYCHVEVTIHRTNRLFPMVQSAELHGILRHKLFNGSDNGIEVTAPGTLHSHGGDRISPPSVVVATFDVSKMADERPGTLSGAP